MNTSLSLECPVEVQEGVHIHNLREFDRYIYQKQPYPSYSSETSVAIFFIMEKVFKFVTPTNPEELAQFYRDLEDYLHPIGTGDWDQLKTLAIIGDSFTAEGKVKSEVGHVPRQHLPMLPHGTKSPMLAEGRVYRTVKVENLSMGGATMNKMLEKKRSHGKMGQ